MTDRHLPGARISANGKDITTELLAKDQRRILVSLTVTDEAGIKTDTCTLVVDNREGWRPPPIGSEIEVWLGYEPAPERMGLYRIDEWSMSGPPSTLTITGKSAELTTAIKEPKLRLARDGWHTRLLCGKRSGLERFPPGRGRCLQRQIRDPYL